MHLKNITMDEVKVPVWMLDFNGTSAITNDWKMWYNGYSRPKLKQYFADFVPQMLENQTLREMCMPLIPNVNARDYLNCVTLNEKHENFFYPIAISWWINYPGLIEASMEIPDFIIDKIKDKKAKILLYNNREQWGYTWWRENVLKLICDKYPAIQFEDFAIACNNPDLRGVESITLMTNQAMPQSSSYFCSHELMRDSIRDKILNPTANEHNGKGSRPWKFVCLLRRPSPVRWAISAELMQYRFDNDALMSMSCDIELIPQNGIKFEKLEDGYYEYMRENFWAGRCTIPGYDEAHHKYTKTSELLYKWDKEYPFWIQNDTNPLTNPLIEDQIWKFTDSYLHIVSETYFVSEKEGVCLSEKVFKPIWYMQPFVVFGSAHTLSALRELGYKTFDKWIDESYDTIDDQVERFYSAISSIKKFVDQDAETLDEIMKEILPVLEHNVQVLDHNNEHLYKDFKQSLVDSLGK